jgi:molecular chaperone GrpE
MEEKITEQEQTTDNNAPVIDINADENAAGTTHLNDEIAEESAMEKLQMELEEQKDKYLRLVAEFDNFRKRTAREKLDLIQTAGKDVIIPILNVLDDCDRAEQQIQNSEDVTLIKEGIQLVFAKLRTTMQSLGVKEMESIGLAFDVEKHEAITDIPAPTEEQKDTVIDQIQKGYYLNEKLIRFAKVVVGK